MTEKLHESLSALMDNEADELELRRILKAIESSETLTESEQRIASELQDKWHRYHILSACLKQELHTSPSRNLLTGIKKELAPDSLPAGKSAQLTYFQEKQKGILQFLGQGAIAASVALAVLFTADLALVADNDIGSDISTELAGDLNSGQLPGLTGELNPATNTRVAVQTSLDEEEMNRLQRVVSEELEDALDIKEVPAIFILDESP